MSFLTFFIYFSISYIIVAGLFSVAHYIFLRYQTQRLRKKLNTENIKVVKIEDLLDNDDKSWH